MAFSFQAQVPRHYLQLCLQWSLAKQLSGFPAEQEQPRSVPEELQQAPMLQEPRALVLRQLLSAVPRLGLLQAQYPVHSAFQPKLAKATAVRALLFRRVHEPRSMRRQALLR